MLHQSEALAPLGTLAVQHREHLDGSSYPRGLSGKSISMSIYLQSSMESPTLLA